MDRRTFFTAASAFGLTGLLGACSRRGGPQVVSGNLVSVASAYPELSTMVSLVQTAELATTLGAEGSYTVFAPTNAAFAALPEGSLNNLQQPANRDLLVQILAYHVLPRVAPARQFAGQQMNVVTAEGQSVRVDGTRGGVRINGANVLRADIAASNGIIHVIDQVLVP